MTTDSWINETLYPAWGQRFQVKRELARVKSEFQDIVIFESFSHGRVMVLDGVIQITEGDEFVYQEMLTHVPLLAHGHAANVRPRHPSWQPKVVASGGPIKPDRFFTSRDYLPSLAI